MLIIWHIFKSNRYESEIQVRRFMGDLQFVKIIFFISNLEIMVEELSIK